jgi:hypothetical protein
LAEINAHRKTFGWAAAPLKIDPRQIAADGPGLPDGIFSNQNTKFGYILECLAMKDAGKFYGHLEYLTVIWYILWQFGISYGNLVYLMAIWYILWSFGIFFPVLVCFTKKNLATLCYTECCRN